MTNQWVKVFVVLIPVYVVLIALISWCIYAFTILCKKRMVRKKQYVMFGSLKKGDYVWSLVGDKITEHEVRSVTYEFTDDNKVKYVRVYISDSYENLVLLPNNLKTSKYTNGSKTYYTFYKEAEAKRYFTEITRKKELDSLLYITPNDLKLETDRMCREIENMGEETRKKLELKLN